MGALLCGEILEILEFKARSIIISGQSALKKATELILKEVSDKIITVIPDEVSDNATTLGMVKIFEYKKRGC